ncbi:MAG: VWA domain-containing protein [Rhodobiaceae bacterium]|nr:VWA domain-containing protein [Rhodobiaceae bacterium]MCC0016189.1 VWA domain-containing protein [Rhodobiaceae bacterium]MCC0041206.1 VWA domain-containing protein [Rhodobiaceae bacterium]
MLRNRFFGTLRRLLRDTSGAVAILFAMLVPALLIVVGIGIDYGRASSARSTVASVLDAALLSAGRELSVGTLAEADVQSRVSSVFGELLAETSISGATIQAVTATLDKTNGRVQGNVTGISDTSFGGLVGLSTLDFSVNASVNYNTLTVELSMVLDVTGSMGGQKIADLKSAAKGVVQILLPEDGSTSDKVRMALAPYNHSVNVGAFAASITGDAAKQCVVERDGLGDFDDTPPKLAPFQTTVACPAVTIAPLTSNRTALIGGIDSYTAGGSTAGHLGIAWGWYLLSPRWNDVWPSTAKPAAYGTKDLIKVMILMTDGQFNTWYVNGNGASGAQAKKVCKEAKDKGVIIYSVAFQAPASAQNLLKKCATSETQHYFNATTGEALKNAFEAIAIEIRNLRLSS